MRNVKTSYFFSLIYVASFFINQRRGEVYVIKEAYVHLFFSTLKEVPDFGKDFGKKELEGMTEKSLIAYTFGPNH